MHRTGCRRLWALFKALPPEAAVWRHDSFTTTDELLAQLLERTDAWQRAIFTALIPPKKGQPRRISLPAPVEILRPDDEPPQRKVETDPRVIAAWFSQHFK